MVRRIRRGSGALLACFGPAMVLFSAPRAQAQSFGPVFVQLHAGDGAYSVIATGGPRNAPQPVIATCDGDCGFWAWPGPYKLHFAASGDEHAKNLNLRVRAPGDYTFVPANVGMRNTGLTLGIIGPTIAFVGLIVAVVALSQPSCDDDSGNDGNPPRSCATPPGLYYGLETLAVGAGIGTLGWIMFAQNRPRVVYRPLAPAAATAPSMTARVGLVPLSRGGFGLGATVAF
jgi:hypothetical protein